MDDDTGAQRPQVAQYLDCVMVGVSNGSVMARNHLTRIMGNISRLRVTQEKGFLRIKVSCRKKYVTPIFSSVNVKRALRKHGKLPLDKKEISRCLGIEIAKIIQYAEKQFHYLINKPR